MTAGTEQAFESATLEKLFNEAGMKILRNALACSLDPDTALECVASVAIQKRTRMILSPERIKQVTEPLIDNPKVRGRLRRAGFKVTVRTEAEFTYMMEAV